MSISSLAFNHQFKLELGGIVYICEEDVLWALAREDVSAGFAFPCIKDAWTDAWTEIGVRVTVFHKAWPPGAVIPRYVETPRAEQMKFSVSVWWRTGVEAASDFVDCRRTAKPTTLLRFPGSNWESWRSRILTQPPMRRNSSRNRFEQRV